MPGPIGSIDAYEAATRRIVELEGAAEGTPEAAELKELVAAVSDWDEAHDDVTAWTD